MNAALFIAEPNWVYPRVCGGTAAEGGLWTGAGIRSIPACAGEPVRRRFQEHSGTLGLSPRVRGNP